MIIRLQHQRSDGESDLYHLKSGRRYHIGRGSGCEVRILDLKLSRKHCAIEFDDDGWKLVDLASTNGCKLDGEQLVGTAPLKPGSVIMIGQTELSVTRILADDEVDDDAAAPPEIAEESAEPATKEPTEKVRVLHSPATIVNDSDNSGEHKASDWEPLELAEAAPAAPAANGKKGIEALVPIGEEDDDLAALRKQAQASAERAKSDTGQLKRPTFPTPEPGSLGSSLDKPLIARNAPSTTTPAPVPAPLDLDDSGPFKSLSPRAPSSDDDLFLDSPAKPAAKEKPSERKPAAESISEKIADKPAERRPGTASERRAKPKVVPIILKAVDSDEDSSPLPTTPARGTPILASGPAQPVTPPPPVTPPRPSPTPLRSPSPASFTPPAAPKPGPVQGRVIASGDTDNLELTTPTLQPRLGPPKTDLDDLLDFDPPKKPAPAPRPPTRPFEPMKPKPVEAARTDTPRLPPRTLEPPRSAAFEQDLVKTLPAFQFDENKAPPPKPAAPVPGQLEEKPFFITVLGRRVGPLTREKARDLKARELKGTLTAADLEPYT